MKVVSATFRGTDQEINQDAVMVNGSFVEGEQVIKGDLTSNLIFVADGMGGLREGHLASRCVCETVASELRHYSEITSELLNEAFIRAHIDLLNLSRSRHGFTCMGSTLCAVVVSDTSYLIANVGDTRCYLSRDGILEIVTKDDHIDPQESSVLSQCMGGAGHKQPVPHIRTIERVSADALIICSDGFYKELNVESVLNTDTLEILGKQTLDDATFVLLQN